MLVVADTSPLHYLILVNQTDLLHTLYGHVTIPIAVAVELSHAKAPQAVRNFVDNPPQWLSVQEPSELLNIDEIDAGERAAISLAVELSADLLLIDDLDGRRAAVRHGLRITGVVGILLAASELGLIDLRTILTELSNKGLYLSKDLLNRLLGDSE
jgi:predicted nucleic acid-binding protein